MKLETASCAIVIELSHRNHCERDLLQCCIGCKPIAFSCNCGRSAADGAGRGGAGRRRGAARRPPRWRFMSSCPPRHSNNRTLKARTKSSIGLLIELSEKSYNLRAFTLANDRLKGTILWVYVESIANIGCFHNLYWRHSLSTLIVI